MWLFSRPCIACQRTTQDAFCEDCALDLPPASQRADTIAAWDYVDAVIQAVSQWKSSADTWRDSALLDASLARTKAFLDKLTWDTVVVVPPSPLRAFTRAFHPPDAFARRVARTYGTRFSPRALWRLDFARQRGMRISERLIAPRFTVVPWAKRRLKKQRVLLVDDVLTTGATLRHAEATLSACDAQVVGKLVLARVPKRKLG